MRAKGDVNLIPFWTALSTEASLSHILIDHLRRQNLISWNESVQRDPATGTAHFNNYPFSAARFSWLSPVLGWAQGSSKPKPIPVLFHVSATECKNWDVDGFVERIKRAGANQTSKRRFLGVIAAPSFQTEAFQQSRKEGFLTMNLRDLFGEAAFNVIVECEKLLKFEVGPGESAINENYLSNALEGLRNNPFIADLKALAFETASAFALKQEGWEEVTLNSKVPFRLPKGNTERELDVSAQKHSWDQIYLIECKAEPSDEPLSDEYVRKFFTESVPAFLAHKATSRNPSHCRAEIWTTGIVTDLARDALKTLQLKSHIKPNLLGRTEILEKLPRGSDSIKRLINVIAETGKKSRRHQTPTNPDLP